MVRYMKTQIRKIVVKIYNKYIIGIDRLDTYMGRCMGGWIDGYMDIWIYGWMDGWMDGWIYGCMYV